MKLKLTNIEKTYPNGVKALDDINLTIEKGMFGLLGPNGAGKSSLMRTIATLQLPNSGTVLFKGLDAHKDKIALRKVLGYLPQEFGVYPHMSAEKLLDYFAQLKGLSDNRQRAQMIDYALDMCNLTEVKKKAVSTFSGGMKQRFGIAQILLNKPELVIVDEPTAGLDPAEKQRFLNILREIGTESIVIFSTHIVDDVNGLCTDMAILNRGKIVTHATPKEAIEKLKGKVFYKDIQKEELGPCQNQYRVLSSSFNPDHSVNVRIWAETNPGDGFKPDKPNLEDVYFISLNVPEIL